jgi:putative multiple sugar transport system ATP-binding protein
LFQEMTIEENIVAASVPFVMKSGLYDRSKVKEVSDETKSRFRIAASHPQQRVINLSGGNQQKVMLAKWLLTHPDVLIIDEPTHGIDIGAKYEIYEILKKLAAEGKAILMISSELPELIGLCDRIIVVKKGTVVGQVVPPDMTEEKVISLAT